MTTLDLKDAYLSVPVHKDSQKFLQFLWRDKCYAFQGLCFGLNTAPRIFTKLLKPVAAFLRKRGVRMILYLDDFLILGSTYQEAQSHTALAVSLLESLGFTINREKSRLIPTQIITFLGFVIDSTVETLSLPQEKVVKVKSLCTLDEGISVTPTTCLLVKLFSKFTTLFITTDASKTGWGAVCESQRTNGRWSVSERTQHINVLKLKAAFLALKSFLKKQFHKVVCLRMDNTTAVAHVNNKGGTHSPCLLALTLELWMVPGEEHHDISSAYPAS